MKLVDIKILKGTIEVLTGLHIGGAKNSLDIGGLDSPVIKTPTGEPYIPGSSLKGKIRTLLALHEGSHNFDSESALLKKMFGYTGGKSQNEGNDVNSEPRVTRIIFRDAYLDKDDFRKRFKDAVLETTYTEGKYENVINRLTGKADGPGARQIERIPAGGKFSFEIVINQFDGDNVVEMENKLREGVRLLENNYLGGSGTRGYGKVKFTFDE